MNENKESVDLSLRGFIKSLLSVTGGAALLSSMPWLLSCTPEKLQELGKEKARLGLIGSGSRGQYHIHNLLAIPHADLVAICDPYAPNREAALALRESKATEQPVQSYWMRLWTQFKARFWPK